MKSMLTLSFCLTVSGLVFGQVPNNDSQFPPRVSRAGITNKDGVMEHGVKITSGVSKIEVTLEVVKAFKDQLKEYGVDVEFIWGEIRDEIETKKAVYKYTYTIENAGLTRLKVNFSDWNFLHSLFTETVQDFSFELNPGEVKTVQFVAHGQPEEITSPINAGVWNNNRQRWSFAGWGFAGFYKSRWNSFSIQASTTTRTK